MKLLVTKGAAVNRAMFANAGYEVVDSGPADYEIAWKGSSGTVPRERVVLLQSEPPVAGARLTLYGQHAQFLAVGCYCPVLANEFALTDTPAYPYRPAFNLWAGMKPRPKRGTGIYFAGRKGMNVSDATLFGGRRQYEFRASFASGLRDKLGGVCVGRGWPRETKSGDWHRNKVADVMRHDPDFVCGFENCIYPWYVSEKFWDAVLCRRLALYIGCPFQYGAMTWPNFVDLRGLSLVAVSHVADQLRAMDDEEYLERVDNQTTMAMEYEGLWEKRRDWVTGHCIEILEGA